MNDVIILGGGYAGLGAALRLGDLGIRSTLLEASPGLGGLAACVKIGGVTLEGSYHHIKPDETHLIGLIRELGMEDRLNWRATRMGFCVEGRIYGFSSVIDLMRFRPFSWIDKLSFGVGTLKAKYTNSEKLRGMDARTWICNNWGSRIFDLMLGPMLQNKFGIPAEEISAGFLHGRIKGLARTKSNVKGGERLGYLRGSLEPLTDRLAVKCASHADIRVSCAARSIERHPKGFTVGTEEGSFPAEFIINTLPLDVFERLEMNFTFSSGVAYQGALTGIYMIRERPTDYYWINIIDDETPFKVIVNQTIMDDYPCSVLYCGRYLNPDDPVFAAADADIVSADIASLERIFGPLSVIESRVFRTEHGTPIFDSDFEKKKEYLASRVPNIVFAGNVEVFPHMRTVSNVLATGYRAAEVVAGQSRSSLRS